MEVVALLAVIGILTQNVAAAWQPVLARFQARTTASALIDAIRMARNSSVSLRHAVTLCPTDGGKTCSGEWQNALMVFADRNEDGSRSADEPVLRMVHAADARGTLTWRAFRKKPWLQFLPLGHTAAQNGSFVYCPPDGNLRHAAVVIVNKLGHSRIARDRDGDGVVEMASGRPVACE